MTKELVKEKVTRHDSSRDTIPTPCGRGSGCVSEASYNHRGGVNISIDSKNPSPQPSPARGEGEYLNNSGNSQSQLNVTGLFAYWLIRLFAFSNHFTHSTHLTHLKKAAFTLAETLITLGVIGIVAAMTIPTLINNYQEKVTVTKVKKMFSTLNQAVKLAEVDNGPVNTWDLPAYDEGGSQKLYGYLKPYLKVLKECIEDNSGNCLDTSLKYYYLNGRAWSDPNSYYGDNRYVRIILADGAVLWLRSKELGNKTQDDYGVLGQFWYDVNGSSTPNTMGKDIFSWFLIIDGFCKHIIPDDCYLNNKGYSCADWILKHDNMDYPDKK